MLNKKNMLVLRMSRKRHKAAHELEVNMTAIMEVYQLPQADLSIFSRVIGIADGAEDQEWIAAARHASSIVKFDCLGIFSEPAEYIGIKVAKELKLPYLESEVVKNTHSKFAMRNKLAQEGVENIKIKKIVKPFEKNVKKFFRIVGGPIIIKPIDSRGSAGVSRIDNETGIQGAIEWMLKSICTDEFIAEEFLEGEEYSVEAFSENGEHFPIAVTKKIKENNHFVELGHILPAEIPGSQRDVLFSYIKLVLTALGVNNGPTHTELILTESGPKVVETHLRNGGDNIDELVKLTTGIDLDQLWIKTILGEKVKEKLINPNYSGVAGIQYFAPSKLGEIADITGIEEIKKSPYAKKVSVLIQKGERATELFDSSARAFYVISKAENYSQLNGFFNLCTKKLQIKIL